MIQLSSARRLAILYIKQPLLLYHSIIVNAPFSHFLFKQPLLFYRSIKQPLQPLLFVSFNYPQRAV